MHTPNISPVVLLIIDGWGLSPTWRGNAIAFGGTPNFEELWQQYPHTVLQTVPAARLGPGETSGSDIGQAMIGTGRMLRSDLEELKDAVKSGLFATNPVLTRALEEATAHDRSLHLIGLAGNGGVHSDLSILKALLTMARTHHLPNVFLHLITDGVDTPSGSAVEAIREISHLCANLGVGTISTVIGRQFAMDRDQDWQRTLRAYQLWTAGVGRRYPSTEAAVTALTHSATTDDQFPASVITERSDQFIRAGDLVICWNGRSDRLRQMVRVLTDRRAPKRGLLAQSTFRKLGQCVTLIAPRIDEDLPYTVAFPPAKLRGGLGEILASRGIRQLRIAESEKTSHVREFFDGGRTEPFPETHFFLPQSNSPTTYLYQTGLQTPKLLNYATHAIAQNQADFYLIHLGNIDLVAHTGNLTATTEAVRVVDRLLPRLRKAVLAAHGRLLITSDHGHAERLLAQPDRYRHRHTTNPVPLLLIETGRERNVVQQALTPPSGHLGAIIGSRATLADIAPTILELYSIPIPVEMTGQSLLAHLQ